jgi:predicted acylesterase/phospholipase RssA
MSTALVLVGAGAAGIHQVGHITAILESGIDFGFLAGTSSGSINAATLRRGDINTLVDAWSSVRNKDIFSYTPSSLAGFFQPGKGIASSAPLRKFISKHIGDVEVDKDRTFLISATDEVNRTPFQKYAQDLTTRDQYLDMIWASASIPILFPVVKWSDSTSVRSLSDGGLTANAAIREAVEWGAESIYVSIPRNSPPKPVGNAIDRVGNMITTFMENMVLRELKLIQAYNKVDGKRFIKLCVIQPTNYTNVGIVDFDGLGSTSDRKALIQIHKEDALKQLSKFYSK